MDREETYTGGVDACDDKIGTDMTLIAEQVLFEHCHNGHDTRRAAGGEGVKLEVGGDEGGGEFGVGRCAGAGAKDGRRDVVQLFAVLSRLREISDVGRV